MNLINKAKSIFNAINNNGKCSVSVALNYRSPSGGYMNYAIFAVTGINANTNRKNTKRFECKTESEARTLAASEGLINIETVVAVPFDNPTERQIEACKMHKRIIPEGACMKDVSFLMDKDINEEKDAPIDLIRYADSLGLKFSYLAGEETLKNLINNK